MPLWPHGNWATMPALAGLLLRAWHCDPPRYVRGTPWVSPLSRDGHPNALRECVMANDWPAVHQPTAGITVMFPNHYRAVLPQEALSSVLDQTVLPTACFAAPSASRTGKPVISSTSSPACCLPRSIATLSISSPGSAACISRVNHRSNDKVTRGLCNFFQLKEKAI